MKWLKLLAVILIGVLVFMLDTRWPGIKELLILSAALVLGLAAVVIWGVARGLRVRSLADWRVESRAEQILVHRDGRCIQVVPLSRVVSGLRVVSVESLDTRLLDDALTLRDAHGHVVLRCPGSATGVLQLLRELDARGVPVTVRDLEA